MSAALLMTMNIQGYTNRAKEDEHQYMPKNIT